MKISPADKIFVDTSALIALVMAKDVFHIQASAVMGELENGGNQLVTTEFVLVEFANSLSKVRLRHKPALMLDKWTSLSTFQVIWSSRQLFDKAFDFFRERPDKDWSLTDCASFVVMKDHQIDLAFTSDKHFEQAGFKKLLGD